jgi:hypothetical protein
VIFGHFAFEVCPSDMLLATIGPWFDDVVSMSTAFVPNSAPWNVAPLSWMLSPTGTPLSPLPFATIVSNCVFGSQFVVSHLLPGRRIAQKVPFLIRSVPEA